MDVAAHPFDRPGFGGGNGDARCHSRETRHVERDCRGPALNGVVGLGQLLVDRGEADAQSFGLAEPGFAFRLGDAGR
jgi:hypothetical protein